MENQLGPHLPQNNTQNIKITTQHIHQQLTIEVRLLARKEEYMSNILPLNIYFVFSLQKLVLLPKYFMGVFHNYPLEISNFAEINQTKLNSI